MIPVTRLDGKQIVVNATTILYAESTPDTVLYLIGGERVIVKESLEEVTRRSVRFHRKAGATIVRASQL